MADADHDVTIRAREPDDVEMSSSRDDIEQPERMAGEGRGDDEENPPAVQPHAEGDVADDVRNVSKWLQKHCSTLGQVAANTLAKKLVGGGFDLEARGEWQRSTLEFLKDSFELSAPDTMKVYHALAEDSKGCFGRACGPCSRNPRATSLLSQFVALAVLAGVIVWLRLQIVDTQADVSSLKSDSEAARDTLDELLVRSGALEANINDAIAQADSRTSAALAELDVKLNATLNQVDDDVQAIRDGVANETAALQRNLSAQAASLEASVRNQTAAILATVGDLNNTVESLDLGLLQDLQQELPRLKDNVTDVLDELMTDSVANTLLDVRADVTGLQGDFAGLDATVRVGEPVVLRSGFGDLVTTAREKNLTTHSVAPLDQGAQAIGSPKVLNFDVSAGDTLLITYDAQVLCQAGYCDLAISVEHSAGIGARTTSGFVYEVGQVRFARYFVEGDAETIGRSITAQATIHADGQVNVLAIVRGSGTVYDLETRAVSVLRIAA